MEWCLLSMTEILLMPTGRVVYRETRQADGVAYEVLVYTVDGGLYGTFKCPVCDVTEVNQVVSGTAGEAIKLTLTGVDSHHAVRHRLLS
jgi:hypothetical protein